MEDIINNLIKIDKETSTLVQATYAEINEERERLTREISDLEINAIKRAKDKGESLFNSIITEGKEEEKRINTENLAEIKEIDDKYNEEREYLLDYIFNKYILGNE